jgi:hypothetical protein
MINKLGGSPSNRQPMQLNVPLDQMSDIECECGCKIFTSALKFKRVSALLSPTGQEQVLAMETIICTSCQKELEMVKNAAGGS